MRFKIFGGRWWRRGFVLIFLGGFSVAHASEENPFDAASGVARGDLESALQELRETREAVSDEKIPMVRRQRELEGEVGKLRRELRQRQREGDTQARELESLRSEVTRRRDQQQYQQGLLGEYLRELESALPVSELETFAPLLRTARADHDEDLDQEDRASSLRSELTAASHSLARIRDQIGGRIYEGEAAGPEGEIEAGEFLELGPVVLFSANGFSGISRERVGSLKAHVGAPEREQVRLIRELVQTGRGILPFDPTLDQATRRAEARTTLADRVRAGGVVMVPILALALGALVVALLKWMQIAGMQVAGPGRLQEILGLLEKDKKTEAAERAGGIRGPVGDLLQAAVENAHERREILEEILYERILSTQPRLERFLPFLALTAAAAPLLGLLGTVTGMINTFQLITLFGTGDARTLSGGISEALITTQFGLGVAIIALLVHALLSRKAKGIIANMEQTEAAFLNGLPDKTRVADA